MKVLTIFGEVLIALGVIALVYQGVTYTTEKKVIDIGPIQGSVEEKNTIPLPPILGVTAVIAGTAILLVGAKKS